MKISKKQVLAVVAVLAFVASLSIGGNSASAQGSGAIVLQGTTSTIQVGCDSNPACTLNEVVVDGQVIGTVKFIAVGLDCHPTPSNCESIVEANYYEPVTYTLYNYGTFVDFESGKARPISPTVAAFDAKTLNVVSTDGNTRGSFMSHGYITIDTDESHNRVDIVLIPLH